MRWFGPAAVVLALSGCCSGSGSSSSSSTGGTTAGSGGTTSGGTTGGGMVCTTCFLHGRWQVDNLEPCFFTDMAADGGPTYSASSSTVSGAMVVCPMDFTMPPPQPWSTDTLTTDCPGHYRLCMTLEAGDSKNPQAGDCTMAQSCADGDYAAASQSQSWMDLPSWLAMGTQLSCVQPFFDTGGYAEMSVSGSATGCGSVARAFAWVRYCPLSCNTNPNGPGCGDCGGTGTF
jgi:hypothetical protein